MKKGRNKRKGYAPGINDETKKVIDHVIRMRARMRVKDAAGGIRLFRSTILEEDAESEEKETEDGDG